MNKLYTEEIFWVYGKFSGENRNNMAAVKVNYICGKHITENAIVIEIYRTQWVVRLLPMTDCILLFRFHDVLSQTLNNS